MIFYMGEALRGVRGAPLYVAGSAEIASTRVFAKKVNVYEKAQKNLGESTHPIDNTRLMQMMIKSSSGTDGTT